MKYSHSYDKTDWKRLFAAFLIVILAFGALGSGYLFFTTVRALTAQTSLPLVTHTIANPSPVVEGDDRQVLPDLEQKDTRVNILLLGIDQREGDAGPWRTDTMILVSMDLATRETSMLSIPRDLWVTIPSYGENRINTAHSLGDQNDYPGGGVALAKKTVSQVFGVPVHYYVRINFAGFEKLVDAIGGIDLYVETAIHDATYPDEHYGTIVVDIPAGQQHMDGKTALQYARSRHGTGDFDRMARQKDVIFAARDKAIAMDIPLTSIPKLLALAGDSLKTDLSLSEMFALAPMVAALDMSTVRSGIIDASMTHTSVTPSGAMVEVPDWDKIQALVQQLFPSPMPSAAPTPSLVQVRLADEQGRIELLNGTSDAALAERVAQELRANGFNVVQIASADHSDYAYTEIVSFTDKTFTLDTLVAFLSVDEEYVAREGMADNPEGIDLRVILGRDRVSIP